MGAIRKVFNDADNANADLKEAQAHLDTLTAFAESKAAGFEELIKVSLLGAGTGTDRTVPITEIIQSTTQTHAYLSSNASDLEDRISGTLSSFIKHGDDNTKKGIGDILHVAITTLFGNTEADEATSEEYIIALEGISLIRLDFKGWKRAVTAESLTKKVEQVSAFCLVKSTVDIQKLDRDTFLYEYQAVLQAANKDATVEDMITEANRVYDKFGVLTH